MGIHEDRFSTLRSRSSAAVLVVVLTPILALQPQVPSAQKVPADARFHSLPPDALAQDKQGGAAPDAKALYKQHCQLCHLDGSAPIAELNFADGQWKHGSGVNDIVTVVRDGSPGTAMLGFKDKLTEKEILALAEYVRTFDKSLKGEKPKKSAKPRD